MAKGMQKTLMPLNRADVGYMLFHMAAEIALAVATGLDNASRFAAINSNYIDSRKIEKIARREFEDAVRHDLESIEVKDG